MNIVQALSAVMADVGAVRKSEQNSHQGFSFRGIDTVVKAVYPALVEHGVIVVPEVLESDYSSVEIGSRRTPMALVRVTVRYTFHGPEGDSIITSVAAEAMDSGDKATAKAMSVAFRTALLQALCLPTDDPDPDSHSYERAPAFDEPAFLLSVAEELAAASTVAEARHLWQKVGASPLSQEARSQMQERIAEKAKALEDAEPKAEEKP